MYDNISLAKEAMLFVTELKDNAEKYNVKITKVNNATIIDCGINTEGSIQAALLFTKITLGGLAKVTLDLPITDNNSSFLRIQVASSHPTLAAIGCQAASWNINKDDFFGMACGPGRALAQKPSKVFKLLEYKDNSDIAILCIESDKVPSEDVVSYIAEKCNVKVENLILLLIKTECLVEYIQMAARAIELGLFKLVQHMNYPKERILHAVGTGLIPPLSVDKELSNDRVNNALIYGTKLFLIVKSEPGDNLLSLLPEIPSNASKSYGKSFLELFKEADEDFANFDLTLLAPSELIVNDIRTGEIHHLGKIDNSKIV
ncbi:MAG: methenyltetrahydromethanopterin cyclohydrolase [Asgard group archaeon]|nr:methenyltetrahydromethanopterin cyclohydrolase [Asgard group archaeon]